MRAESCPLLRRQDTWVDDSTQREGKVAICTYPGSAGSARLRFIATFDLRRLAGWEGRLRLELVEDRRDSWFCMPALIVAAAASETEDGLLGEWEPVGGSPPLTCTCDPDGEREGGKEFRSGILIVMFTDTDGKGFVP